ncbi:MAG: hypothetical protein ACTSPB_00425 [Candidatus Thorarchaeota archaeon]
MEWHKRGFWYLTKNDEVQKLDRFLSKFTFTKKQYWYSYPQWGKGGKGWIGLGQGGTGIMKILCWYHHIYKIGSKEWRPKIIIKAVVEEAMKMECEQNG